MSYIKELLQNILELHEKGHSPEEISIMVNYPYDKVVSALERWFPDFIIEE